MKTIRVPRSEVGPFVFYGEDETILPRDRKEFILINVRDDEELEYYYLPQLDLDVYAPSVEEAIGRMYGQILTLYAGLKELPDEFITKIEEFQIQLIESRLLPWLAVQFGKHPRSFTPPPTPVPDLSSSTTGKAAV